MISFVLERRAPQGSRGNGHSGTDDRPRGGSGHVRRLITGTFDASTRVFVDATSVSAQEVSPNGIAFSSDGARMFVVGSDGDDVNEYALSTPFDASTAAFVDAFSVSAQEVSPNGIAFSSDGAKMFVVGSDGDDVNEYALSAAFDASTAAFVDAFSVSAQETMPSGIAFSNDGIRMFVTGLTGQDINEYALTASFDASTASFVDATPVSSQETEPTGIAFSNDGTRMFVVGSTGDDVNEYTLFPFDASTASFVDATSVSSQETLPTDIAFSNDGAKMFVVGSGNDSVNEYDLFSVYPIAVASTYDQPPPTLVSSVLGMATGNLAITFSDVMDAENVVPARIHVRESGTFTGGVTLTASEFNTAADSTVVSFTLSAAHLKAVSGMAEPELTVDPGAVRDTSGRLIAGTFDASTASFVDAFSVSAQETDPQDLAFSNDGARMFVVGTAGGSVNEYALSDPFDASSAEFVDAFSVSAQETAPNGIAVSSHGARMFVVGTAGGSVNEYALSDPFDASTASFVDATSVSAQEDTRRASPSQMTAPGCS